MTAPSFGVAFMAAGHHVHCETLTPERLVERIGGDDTVLVYIHGYNNTFDEALWRGIELSQWFGGFEVIVIAWPSHGQPLKYTADTAQALKSADEIGAFLERIHEDVAPSRLRLVAHSLGSYALAEALATIPAETYTAELTLLAPDLDVSRFVAQYAGRFRAFAQRVTVYMDAKDKALLAATAVRKGKSVRLGRKGARFDGFVVDSSPLPSFSTLSHSDHLKSTTGIDLRLSVRDGLSIEERSARGLGCLVESGGVRRTLRLYSEIDNKQPKPCESSK